MKKRYLAGKRIKVRGEFLNPGDVIPDDVEPWNWHRAYFEDGSVIEELVEAGTPAVEERARASTKPRPLKVRMAKKG